MPAQNHFAEPRSSVVIVDDEKSYVDMLAHMIGASLDCPVHHFSRPSELLGILEKLSPAVVVTDYSMPDMDGMEFTRQASLIVPKAAFIMISGNDLDPLAHELAELKSLKLRLRKPFPWQTLAEGIVKHWPGPNVPTYRP
jgi:CheY-like chemotaxis protein